MRSVCSFVSDRFSFKKEILVNQVAFHYWRLLKDNEVDLSWNCAELHFSLKNKKKER